MRNSLKKITVIQLIISIIPLILYKFMNAAFQEMFPIHFNIYGIADSFVNKNDPKVIILCSASIIIFLLMKVLNAIILFSFKKINEENINISNIIINIVTLIIVSGMTLILSYYLFSVTEKFNFEIKDVLLIINITLGIIFIVVGNYMPKFVMNKVSGLRSLSALKNKQVWFELQRIGSKVWIIGGFVNIIVSLLLVNSSIVVSLIINPIIATLIVIIPILYVSYIRKK